MPTKPIGPASETAALVASAELEERQPLRRATSTPRVAATVGADAQQVQRRGQQREYHECDQQQRQRAEDRLEAADVEVAHQPPHGAIRLGEVRHVLDEQDQRGEERVQRDARQQQHRRRHRPPAAASPARRRSPPATKRPGEAGQRHRRERAQRDSRAER